MAYQLSFFSRMLTPQATSDKNRVSPPGEKVWWSEVHRCPGPVYPLKYVGSSGVGQASRSAPESPPSIPEPLEHNRVSPQIPRTSQTLHQQGALSLPIPTGNITSFPPRWSRSTTRPAHPKLSAALLRSTVLQPSLSSDQHR